ncbi:3-oxoacyl-ACP reductase FabG [Rhizomonospora bruguierae]|uniref:3-oxoacyl-ACP reductase FabG n=1 Tax=Rhizomonospora bruguierae TaxID=1581705 RepID=UPI001BCF6FA8|nr:3-oxoacyl-ACP reductase FabG [Micromonospora sp. NBRC 107566]
MGLLDGKTAFITGGGQGLGAAMARRFAGEGAKVAIVDLDGDRAAKIVRELPTAGIAVAADVRDMTAMEAAFQRCVDELGGLDVLVNNAGITRDATIRRMTLDQWNEVVSVHLTGAFIATKIAATYLRAQRSGSIINVSSMSGKVGNIGQANYSSVKAGLVALAKVAAKEFARDGVRVNAIQPGLIRTAMTEALREDIWEKKVSEVPMGRAGTPEEVADVALFLASDLSSYMTGNVLEIAGGRYM